MMQDIESMSLEGLHSEMAAWQLRAEFAAEQIKEIDTEIARRFIDQVQAAYANAGKTDGTLTVDLPNGWKVKSVVRKTVKYDSAILLGVASQMPWERAQKLFKVDVRMTESLYKALDAVDPQLKLKVDEGRTVTTSDPSLELISPDA